MTRAHGYDASFDPAAPVLPVRVARPHAGEDGIALPMLVDTGADCTLVPIEVAHQLQLPIVDTITVTGPGGAKLRANVHAASLDVGGAVTLLRVVALPNEAILGRDALAHLVVVLDAPAGRLSVRRVKPRSSGRRTSGRTRQR